MSTALCNRPVSEVHACADDSKFKFVFKNCPGIPGTYNKGKIKLMLSSEQMASYVFLSNSGLRFSVNGHSVAKHHSEPATFEQRLPNVFGTRWVVVVQTSLVHWGGLRNYSSKFGFEKFKPRTERRKRKLKPRFGAFKS